MPLSIHRVWASYLVLASFSLIQDSSNPCYILLLLVQIPHLSRKVEDPSLCISLAATGPPKNYAKRGGRSSASEWEPMLNALDAKEDKVRRGRRRRRRGAESFVERESAFQDLLAFGCSLLVEMMQI